MITTYKSKAYDAVADINGLKDQLGSVLKEISAFGSRLEETKALQLHADEFGFARSFSYEDRLRDLKQKLQPGKEPAKPVIFLTRMVVESLSRGPMSEKDIKTIVLDRCKELGIKSSNRGLIAGTGMDVATVCSVLAALGAIEATAPPDPKADNSVTNATTSASGGSGVIGGGSGSGSVDYTSSGYTSASSASDVIAGPGAGVYAVLTDRWQSRLSEYIEDALKGKAAALLEAAESSAVGSSSSGGGVSGGMNSASSNGSGGGVVKNVFSNNTSANTSAGVTPSASSNNIVSMASPITAISTTNTTNTIANTNTASTINTLANNTTSNNAQAVNSSSTNNSTNTTNTTNTTATTTNNTINTNTTTTTMSNTARLIAEYHSRNGTDPNTINNNNTNNTNTNTHTAGSVKGVQKPIQNYFVPLNGSVGSVPNANMNSSINSNMQNSNSIQGTGVLNVLNTNTTLPNTQPTTQPNTLPYTSASVPTIGHRAPLSTDLPMVDTTNTSNTTINNTMNSNMNGVLSSTNTTALKQTPYTLPAYQTNVPYSTQPQLHPNTPYTLPLHPYSSNPATTPATVGFLSVTHPTNRLVIPNLNINNNHSEGTLSHSGSMNNVANGSSGGVNGMNSINSSVVGGIDTSMQYGAAPTVHNTMPIVPINSIPPNTTNNTSNATNTTTTTTTTTTKTKTPKAPKPPTEKKLSKKAAAAAAKLLESANASSTNGTVGVNGASGGSGVVGGVVQGSSASSSVAGTITTGNTTNSNKARRGPSALRVWKLREEYVLMDISGSSSGGGGSSSVGGDVKPLLHNTNTTSPIANTTNNNSTTNNTTPSTNTTNAALALLLDPTSLHTTATTHHTLSSTLELEERILRRIAGLCNIPLQPQRYRVGTSVISTSDTTSTENKTRVYSSFKYNTTPVVEEVVEEPSYAVYDDTTTITATYLLDKIRRTKRQRGECLYGNIHLPYTSTSSSVNSARSAAAASVGVYSAPHVHALSAVCSKTNEFYWNTKTAKNKKAAPVKSNEPITMAQYARNVHTGTGGNSIVLSSCSNGSSITNHTLKRYAQPLELTNAFLPLCDMTNRNVFAAATGGAHNTPYNTTNSTNTTSNNGSVVLSIPDLTLNTREIAWTEIAAEFTVLQAPTEEGSIGFGYSSSTAALDSVVSSSAAPKSEKKRKYLGNDKSKSGASGKGKGKGSASTSASSASLAMEVLAPQFTEIVPVTVLVEQIKASSPQAATAYPSSDSEDTSDEACLSRHEATLQSMRDKWTRLQQLKNDALYGVGNGPEVKTYRGGGYGGYFNRNTTASANNGAGGVELSPLGSPVGYDANNKFANLSPRKRGLASAHAKRRGRPPKNAKFHNSNVNIGIVGGSSGSSGGGGGDNSGGGAGEMEVDELL